MLTTLLRLLVLVVAAWAIAAVLLFVVHHDDKPVRANAVFVLSGDSHRLPVGVRLVRQGYAPLLVLSKNTSNRSVLEVAACAHRLGINVLCVQASPFSTVGEAELISRMAAARHWTALDVVTSQYHVLRARILMKRCFHGKLAMVGAPTPPFTLALNTMLESVKLVYHELVHRGC